MSIRLLSDDRLTNLYQERKQQVQIYQRAKIRDHDMEKQLRSLQAEMLRRRLPLN